VITAVPGVRVGHWTDEAAATGCTVVLFPPGTVASGEVRGGAPGTREWELLAPERTVARLDAVVLAGGSAFGLAACDGVMRWCEERGIGVATPAGPVPIVVGAVLYDLWVGDATVRPTAASGYAACDAATSGDVALGRVGAGTGATVGKWRGHRHARPGGIGSACRHQGDLVVAALMAVNAFGDLHPSAAGDWIGDNPLLDTTIGVVATNATLDKVGCLLVAQSAHDGVARALEPAHSTVDGDAIVAAAVGGVAAPLDQVRFLAAQAVEDVIRTAVGPRGGPASSLPAT
jgi:L-aminopeptidase/D-esterase-like protein